jgi:nucleotide-binding universal stress UspA family protein
MRIGTGRKTLHGNATDRAAPFESEASVMTSDERGTRPSLLLGYDGSPEAARAIAIGALLLPEAEVQIVNIWTPPFASRSLWSRLRARAKNLDGLSELLVEEGSAEAQQMADDGVALGAAAGWRPAPLVHRGYGDIGFEFARLGENLGPDAIIVGARGLSGARAALGSVSDSTVHYSTVPVLVIGHPLLTSERRAAATGPILIGYDGSSHAERAIAGAKFLFPGRRLVIAAVGDAEPPDDAVLGTVPGEILHVAAVGSVRSGRAVADALEEVAERHAAAAVVVGSRGQSAGREILLGSVAMAVLHHVHRPTLVVPNAREDQPRPSNE